MKIYFFIVLLAGSIAAWGQSTNDSIAVQPFFRDTVYADIDGDVREIANLGEFREEYGVEVNGNIDSEFFFLIQPADGPKNQLYDDNFIVINENGVKTAYSLNVYPLDVIDSYEEIVYRGRRAVLIYSSYIIKFDNLTHSPKYKSTYTAKTISVFDLEKKVTVFSLDFYYRDLLTYLPGENGKSRNDEELYFFEIEDDKITFYKYNFHANPSTYKGPYRVTPENRNEVLGGTPPSLYYEFVNGGSEALWVAKIIK